MVTFSLATLVGVVVLVTSGATWLNYVALSLAVGGAVVSHWWRWVGVGLAGLGPLVSALAPFPSTGDGVGSETVLIWSLVVFAAFYWSLQGTPGFPLGVGLGLLSAASFGLSSSRQWLDPLVVAALATTIASAAVGSAVSSQRRYLSEAEERQREATLTREAEIQRRIAEERVRIARDLHDMVGHQAAVVSMHLGAAEVHLAGDPEAAARDLSAARAGVQGVLRETQRILEVLRGSPADDTAPTADGTHLATLVESFRRAGHPIDAQLVDLPGNTAAEVGAALYRCLQEALTNAERHGSGITTVRLRESQGLVNLTVTNQASERPGAGREGHGLVGMRERVTAAGGTLTATGRSGTFTTNATLRLDGGPVR